MVVAQLMHTPEMKLFSNHLYELSKGIRHLVLFTLPKHFVPLATAKLDGQGFDYLIQELTNGKVNLFFGRSECVGAVRLIATRPLNELTPEEDFMLGAMLGYDIRVQCERYNKLRESN